MCSSDGITVVVVATSTGESLRGPGRDREIEKNHLGFTYINPGWGGQRCSSQSDRLLLFGEPKAVRLCDGCAREASAENHFVEHHVPLLLGGATLVRTRQQQSFGLLLSAAGAPRQRPVHLRVTRDLSALEELDDEEEEAGVSRGGGIAQGGSSKRKSREAAARRHPLAEVESVEPVRERSAWDAAGWLGKAEEGAAAAAAALVIRLRGSEQVRGLFTNCRE
ncbi:unnamed protein product [Ectocarpus sp. 13 AM-2016]